MEPQQKFQADRSVIVDIPGGSTCGRYGTVVGVASEFPVFTYIVLLDHAMTHPRYGRQEAIVVEERLLTAWNPTREEVQQDWEEEFSKRG